MRAIKVETPGGNKYFLLSIDDLTIKVWSYLLRRKNETLGVLKKFKRLVKKQCERNIKFLRTDRGGEYTSLEFQKYYDDESIKHELTPPYISYLMIIDIIMFLF